MTSWMLLVKYFKSIDKQQIVVGLWSNYIVQSEGKVNCLPVGNMSNIFAKFSLLLLSPRSNTFLSYTGKKLLLRINCRNSVVDVSFGLGITWSFSITTIKVKEVMNLREKEKGDRGKKRIGEIMEFLYYFKTKTIIWKKNPHLSKFAFRQLLSFCSFVLFMFYFPQLKFF